MQRFSSLVSTFFLVSLAACNDAVTEPPLPVEGSFTVDASTAWVYVSLSDSAIVSPTPSARESSAWDIAFNATSVTLNGGAAGPGGVTGACLCQNAAASDAEILAMTAGSEESDFAAVTAVPSTASFVSDQLTPAMSGWYTGAGSSAAADANRTFLVRLADGASFAKARVTAIENASGTSAGRVTLEYAVQPAGSATFGDVKTVTFDATASTSASMTADLNSDAMGGSAGDWDIKLVGWDLLVNGGVSGPGAAGVATTTEQFGALTTATETPPQAYRTDVYAGIFGTNRWYRYNLAGDNRISPTFDVYLLKRGTDVYKLQITNYYSATAQPRHITFRYERIAQ